MVGDKPDYLVGCVGGGSNFAGLVLPFLPRKLSGEAIRFIAVEPKACPTLTRGQFRYDYGDVAKLTPLLKMHTLGHAFMEEEISSTLAACSVAPWERLWVVAESSSEPEATFSAPDWTWPTISRSFPIMFFSP